VRVTHRDTEERGQLGIGRSPFSETSDLIDLCRGQFSFPMILSRGEAPVPAAVLLILPSGTYGEVGRIDAGPVVAGVSDVQPFRGGLVVGDLPCHPMGADVSISTFPVAQVKTPIIRKTPSPRPAVVDTFTYYFDPESCLGEFVVHPVSITERMAEI
jgi:hypothetical protein